MAWLWPTRRGRRKVPPSISGTPQRLQYTPNTASSAAMRMSHHSASSSPPATAWPSTAASTGLPSSRRVGPMWPSCGCSFGRRLGSPLATALRSAPAQKVPWVPVRMATSSVASASKSRNAAASAAPVALSTALRACGRSMLTTSVRARRSHRTVSVMASVLLLKGP